MTTSGISRHYKETGNQSVSFTTKEFRSAKKIIELVGFFFFIKVSAVNIIILKWNSPEN